MGIFVKRAFNATGINGLDEIPVKSPHFSELSRNGAIRLMMSISIGLSRL